MSRYTFDHLADPILVRETKDLARQDRLTTADFVAHIAEIDARKLYLPAAYPSMTAYCIGELLLTEDEASSRIRAGRAARRFPGIFEALADGRLKLCTVLLLKPHLTAENAAELLAATARKSKSEVEQLLAERFPRSEVLTWLESTSVNSDEPCTSGIAEMSRPPVPERVECGAHQPADRVKPLSAKSFAVQFTMSRTAHEKLRYAQELLSHQIPGGDIAAVVEKALDALIPQLEKRKFAATTRPRRGHRARSANPRHIPAEVMRAVWERDGGQCTFVSESGHRCEARRRLEFDHTLEVSRGGEATVDGIRLRCRAHNQYTAECTFGPEFMRHKRMAGAEARAAAKARAAARTPVIQEHVEEVIPWLRALGFSAVEAKRAAERCGPMPDSPLEDRVRHALTCFRARGTRVAPAVPRDVGATSAAAL